MGITPKKISGATPLLRECYGLDPSTGIARRRKRHAKALNLTHRLFDPSPLYGEPALSGHGEEADRADRPPTLCLALARRGVFEQRGQRL